MGVAAPGANVSEEAFRQEALGFLSSHATERVETRSRWGEGSDRVALFAERTPEEEQAALEAAKAWRRQVFDAGFGWLTGPAEYGGRELPASYERLYRDLEGGYAVPSQAQFGIGLGMVAPTILAHGTGHAKDSYLRGLHRGDVVGCQLFSEPGAGSDLASLQTRAERDGEVWRITGQKVWTSGAQFSDIGEIICRTDPDLPKHKGLTGFIVDMRAPGVEVRPLRQMTGGASFNEVFFDNVAVPDDHRLGDVNAGWSVALTTLMNERASIGGGGGVTTMGPARLIELAHHLGNSANPLVRQGLADLYVNTKVATLNNQRAMAKVRMGEAPGPEMSIAKLSLTRNMQRTADLVGLLLGARLTADTGEWGMFSWSEMVLGVPGARVAGGSDEVMKNILGERVLGLPKEPSGPTPGRP